MAHQDARSLSAQSQEDLRHRVIQAVTEKGVTQVQAARLFGVSRQAIYTWLTRYRAKGNKGLASRRRGRPSQPRLKAAQARVVQRFIRDRCPDQLKLPFVLWTREAVQQLIADRTGVQVSIWTVGRYLKRWGFTPQKPLKRAYERDPDAVAHWLETEYPQIREQAQKEDATLWWADEMGMRMDDQGGRSYSMKGHTPVIPGSGQRARCSMMSAITNRGQLCFRVFKGNLNSDVFIDFLRRLKRQSDRKLFVIVDRHPVHRSEKTQKWIDKHAAKVRLIFLPAYSPDLNPDEMLNQDVKSNAVRTKRPPTLQQMMDNVRAYLHSRQRKKTIVKRYFNAPSVQYAAL